MSRRRFDGAVKLAMIAPVALAVDEAGVNWAVGVRTAVVENGVAADCRTMTLVVWLEK
jgi:hypothetical protein